MKVRMTAASKEINNEFEYIQCDKKIGDTSSNDLTDYLDWE